MIYYVKGNIGKMKVFDDPTGGTDTNVDVYFSLMPVARRIVSLGLVNKFVGLEMRAYSNRVGQQFLGFGYVRLSQKNLAGSTIALGRNYPNPFNPMTKFNFAI